MSYRCNRQERCRHLRIEFDVFRALDGDTQVSDAIWRCAARDDERCVPNCRLYESEVGR